MSRVEAIRLRDDGLFLDLPGVDGSGGLRLGYPREGRDLFHPRDVALAAKLGSMLHHVRESLLA
jgi:hypothetical protein